jgi:predicted RNA binding protein YcfA (HicA-like mRNA interferase family)
MSKLPAVRPVDFARVAKRLGFVLDRQKGSYAIYFRPADRLRVVIPMHNKDLKTGTLHGLIEDPGLTRDEFIALL